MMRAGYRQWTAFTLEDCAAEVQASIRHIGAEQLHVLAICQAAVPALAAVSLLASAGEPENRPQEA
ncbi:hypothetical protein PO002_37615 [Cupriavidus necator]|uniref:hypothetical protein n=1 Tax=Cupriavidus necator TaxID=106590 RepID=UPI0039C0A827